MKINIAIDGPSAAGKSTIAKTLAKKLNYIHLDTGAMYRSTAYKAMHSSVNLEDENALIEMLMNTDIQLTPDGKVFLDQEDVSTLIRQDEVSIAASHVSKHPLVRKELVARQQQLAASKGFIMDGRDIGTVVLKDAEVKIFMTASAKARALRRYKQDIAMGLETSDVETIEKEIEERDYQDTHRSASPLVKADDALEIDTSDMSIEQVVDQIYQLCIPFIEKEEN